MAKRKRSESEEQEGQELGHEAAATAVADKPKRGRPRQKILNDPAFESIKEIEEVCDSYMAIMEQVASLWDDGVELKNKLAPLLKKHGLETYSYNGHMIFLKHVEEDKVEIKKNRAAKEDGKQA